MLRSRDCYEPEVWEIEEKEQTEYNEEDQSRVFNNILDAIFSNFRNAEPDYRYVNAQYIA